MRSVELFSGCGGLALGLSRSGFEHKALVEWNEHAVETVLHNKQLGLPHVESWPVVRADVRNYAWANHQANLTLVAGGPPCQPFSVGGAHQGPFDERDMWPVAIRAIREANPRGFLFENVQGLTRKKFSEYLQWILLYLGNPGKTPEVDESYEEHLGRLADIESDKHEYQVRLIKVNAADYGAPQKRKRVFIAGIRSEYETSFVAPNPTHSRERLLWDQWVIGEYWDRHNISLPSDECIARIDQALVRKLRLKNEAPIGLPWVTVRDALQGLGEPNGIRNHVFQDGAKIYPGHTGSPMDMPAKALKAGVHGVPGGENMLVRENGTVRYFTIREAARLQGVPDDYTFPGSWTESMRQLGNAVPVMLAEYFGAWMAETLMPFMDHQRRVA